MFLSEEKIHTLFHAPKKKSEEKSKPSLKVLKIYDEVQIDG